MTYKIKVEKIGRKWITVIVEGKKSTYHAQIELNQLPEVKVGDELEISAKFVDLSTLYGRKFQLNVIDPETEANNIRNAEISKWWGYIKDTYKEHGYIYENGVNHLHSIDCHDYDKKIEEMRNAIVQRKEKERQERRAARELEESKYSHFALAERVERGKNIVHKGKAYHVVSCRYQEYDGWSFGVMQDHYYDVKAIDISDTNEGANLLARYNENEAKFNERLEAKKNVSKTRDDLTDAISKNGVRPEKCAPYGKLIDDNFDIYGSGSQIIVDKKASKIWCIFQNGMDGDNWALNNVPGGICYECDLSIVSDLLYQYRKARIEFKKLKLRK